MDENDSLQAGTLPDDPRDDAVPVPTPGVVSAEGLRLAEFLPDAMATIRRRSEGKDKPVPLPEAWKDTRRLLDGGFWPGESYVLVGNTGTGKTQWAMQACYCAARAGVPVLYIGMEMKRAELAARLLAMHYEQTHPGARVFWSDLFRGRDPHQGTPGSPTLADVVNDKAGAELAELPFYFEEGKPGGTGTGDMAPLFCGVRATHPEPDGQGSLPFLVVLDFLQIVGGENELRERIGKTAYACHYLAREHGAAVLLLSSTARDKYLELAGVVRNKSGSSKIADPALGEGWPGRFVGCGKESGEIEYSADAVLVLCREADAPGKDNPRKPVHLAVAKLRAGNVGWARFDFDGRAFTEPEEPKRTRQAEPEEDDAREPGPQNHDELFG